MKSVFDGKMVADLQLGSDPTVCPPAHTVQEVVAEMQNLHVGSIVIVDHEKKPIGIFTERDLLMKFVGNPAAKLSDPISEYMTPSPKSVLKNELLDGAAVLMRVGRFRHLVVVDEAGKTTGVLSIKDLLEHIVDQSIGDFFG